jgi:CubicO group peptidase (beta-lactamase class C family)
MFLSSLGRVVLVLTLILVAVPSLQIASAKAQTTPARDYWPTNEWRTAPPETKGINAGLLEWADSRLLVEAPRLSGIVAVKGGDIVYERYHPDFQPDQRLHTWSVSKSVTSIAIGMVLEEGLLKSLDQTLGELIPDRIPAGVDPRVYDITVRHLLTMTAGWEWDGRINFSLTHVTDDLDAMMTRPMVCDPGVCFEYDSGASNLLSYIVQEVSGEFMADYLNPRLFEPLGIENPYWIVTEDNANRGGGGLHLTPREMAKIGYLFLNEGEWDGEQIVSKSWVKRSTRAHASGGSGLTGANIGGGPYGYHWWVAEVDGYDAFAALGYGGQMIYVVPELDLVVATAFAEADGTQPDQQQRPRPTIEEVIVQAAIHG